MLTSILENVESSMTFQDAILCTLVSLILGFILAFVYNKLFREGSQNYVISLMLLPVIVQMVIMLVNGNLGTGVAVAGAFALVRFRSLPGTAKEITGIFSAMVIGLATGMGYLTLAVLICVIVCVVLFVAEKSGFGKTIPSGRLLRITIPENLNYTEVFDDIFEKYTDRCSLDKVKTVNMGSMYELTYNVSLKDPGEEKAFIDDLRCRNGNLTIILGQITDNGCNEL